jgi:hypothetical protein
LLRRIPANYVDKLYLVTSVGVEFSIQSIVHCDSEFLVVRGRQAGTSDAGRPFFIPYSQINLLGFQKSIREDEVRSLFTASGAAPAPVEEPEEAPLVDEQLELAEAPLPAPEPPPAPVALPEPPKEVRPAPAAPADGRAVPSKSKVLANLRARMKQG